MFVGGLVVTTVGHCRVPGTAEQLCWAGLMPGDALLAANSHVLVCAQSRSEGRISKVMPLWC